MITRRSQDLINDPSTSWKSLVTRRSHFGFPFPFPIGISLFLLTNRANSRSHLHSALTKDLNGLNQSSLLAERIQEGRDHGLPGYVAYANLVGTLPNKGKDFDDLGDRIPAHILAKLRRVYPTADSIDLHVGLIAEAASASSDALVGKTHACNCQLVSSHYGCGTFCLMIEFCAVENWEYFCDPKN